MTLLINRIKISLMNRLFTFLFLIFFSFSAPSFADDIKDFEIEGMSIGDSALDYLSEEEIRYKKNDAFHYINNKFLIIGIEDSSFTTYEIVQITLKPNDDKYIIYHLDGKIIYNDEIEECYKTKESITNELKDLFSNEVEIFVDNSNHSYDKSGNSKDYLTGFKFSSGGSIDVSCTDWSKELVDTKNFPDQELKVQISSQEFINFLKNEAYN